MNVESNSSKLTIFVKIAATVAMLGGLCLAAVALAGRFRKDEVRNAMTHVVSRGNLLVTVTQQGTLESAENLEIKSKVRGYNAVLWIVDSGTIVDEGDVLVRLDALFIQEQVDERTKYSNWSQSAADDSAARVARARIAVEEYDQGRFQSELLTLEKDVAIARAALQNARERIRHIGVMADSGYLSELEVEEIQFAVKQAVLHVQLKQTQLEVLKNFTHKEQLQTLKGELASVEATHKANVERVMADNSRRDRAVEELQYCVVKAPRSGLVIHPDAAQWETAPIAEGTNVHQNQVLLLMPELNQMQVKVGVHESAVKRVKSGQSATVELPTRTLQGVVTEVASITKPAGWWTGNQVRYDTIVSLPPVDGLRPGTSAEAQIEVARYESVLLIPVASIAEQNDRSYCWMQTPEGPVRREIKAGDSNDVFTIVTQGLQEGDEVLLNPYAYEAPVVEESDGETPVGNPNGGLST
ncbi:efflux RND transporter periplasmic adaptor subunit [Novipirellula artificiosorum]|uniref:Macrolide export protein MacA n=1 Tax=Novipirellula artificiosorum TaxID=2528016 RepID=A0A5C6CWS0_9BACT|nr:HlyD family efflux transporter periplasmic adaptor subunit [Novipirellula artificiosorum]TWU28007.1 Macrolide export protein MacA [Novipirellula artificiosorum]